MPSSYSSNLRLELIADGEQTNTWGQTTNRNIGTLLEQAIAGVTTIALSGTSSVTLSTNNGAADEARRMVLNFIGGASTSRDIICPSVNKVYLVRNASTDTLSLRRASAGTSVTVRPGRSEVVFSDNGNFYAMTMNTYFPNVAGQANVTHTELNHLVGVTSGVQAQLDALTAAIGGTSGDLSSLIAQIDAKVAKSGSTMTGFLTLHSNPSSAMHAATKQYVDNNLAGKQNTLGFTPVNKAGDTMSGALSVPNPSSNLHATNKQYVDAALSGKQALLGYTPVNRAGDTMTGALSVATPTSNLHAANKQYVDGLLATKQNINSILAFRMNNSSVRTTTGYFSGFSSGGATGGGSNPAAGQYVIQRAGWYMFNAVCSYTPLGSARQAEFVIQNASTTGILSTINIYAVNTQHWRATMTTIVHLPYGHTIRVGVTSMSDAGSVQVLEFSGTILE